MEPEHAAATSFDHPPVESVAWRVGRLGLGFGCLLDRPFDRFVELVDTTRVRAFVVASWVDIEEDVNEPVDAVLDCLVAARESVPGAARAVPRRHHPGGERDLLDLPGPGHRSAGSLPRPHGIRGSGFGTAEFPAVRHERLEKLTIQTGGLPAAVVRGVAAADFPALTHLELWLGTPNYDGDAEIADLAPILAGDRLPALRHLGLRNSEIQDDVCAALAAAPVVARLESLDVSLGILTDTGAAALLGGQPLTHLKRLDLHRNYLERRDPRAIARHPVRRRWNSIWIPGTRRPAPPTEKCGATSPSANDLGVSGFRRVPLGSCR